MGDDARLAPTGSFKAFAGYGLGELVEGNGHRASVFVPRLRPRRSNPSRSVLESMSVVPSARALLALIPSRQNRLGMVWQMGLLFLSVNAGYNPVNTE
ncbi:hypothetical protein GCM10027398_33580 [Azotobacter salinestris]